MPIVILVAVLVLAAVVLAVPVRRLVLSGFSGWTIAGYVALMLALAAGVTEARPLSRYLLPVLGLAYLAPFLTVRGGLDRLLGRDRRPIVRVTPVETRAIAPPRDVTPRDVTPRDVEPPRDGGDLEVLPDDRDAGPSGPTGPGPGPSA